MSPKKDNQEPEAKPDVTVSIPHGPDQSVPTTAPPLPIQPVEPTPRPESIITIPELHEETHEHEGRRWPVITMYMAMALVVAAIVVLAGSWIYKKATHQSPKVNKPVSGNQGQGPAAPPTNTPASNPPSGASSNQNTQTTPTTPNGQLPNNGPGDVIAIFIGTALAVGGLHFLYNLRKQN